METISQKDIDLVHDFIVTKQPEFTVEVLQAVKKIKNADVIGALYVLNYLKAVDTIREKTKVLDKSSDFKKKYKSKKNDYDEFKKLLDRNYQLELNYLIDTPEQFKGMCYLLSQALDRQHLICDFDDGVHPKTIFGKCQNEDHYEICDADSVDEELTLTYSYSEDNHKMDKREPYYHCKKCQDDINENAEGYISCDMELVENV